MASGARATQALAPREEESMSAACDRLGPGGGWLVIDRDGRNDVYTPEDDMDGQIALSV